MGGDLSALFASGFAPLLVGLLVLAIGLSLGGPTGYAINPARDLGPRFLFPAHGPVLRAGGRGYVMKQEGGLKLLQAIRRVLEGQIYVSEKISAKILEIFSGRRENASVSPIERLSDREFEVFQLIGEGKGTRQVAEHLRLSVKTVEVHRANIKEKLKLPNNNELIRPAVEWTARRS